MLRIPPCLAAFALLSLMPSCVSPERPLTRMPAATRAVPETAATKIHRYVARHRGWPRSVYHIEQHPYEESYAVFTVVHHGDNGAYPGGGKSFVLFCDPHSYRVARELALQ